MRMGLHESDRYRKTTRSLGTGRADRAVAQEDQNPSDAGIHACRHTFLTEAEKYTDPFTLQYVAGHDSIKTTMRYVHPQEDRVEKLFIRLAAGSEVQVPVGLPRKPQSKIRFWAVLINY